MGSEWVGRKECEKVKCVEWGESGVCEWGESGVR